jgi:hypothetical protein
VAAVPGLAQISALLLCRPGHALGSLPNEYRTSRYPEKILSAVAETAAVLADGGAAVVAHL